MQDDLIIKSIEDSYLSRSIALMQQLITGTRPMSIRINRTLYAPDDLIDRIENGSATQFDFGALAYEAARASGKSKDGAKEEEETFLRLADYHFAMGPKVEMPTAIAESFIKQFRGSGIYCHTTDQPVSRRPFPA